MVKPGKNKPLSKETILLLKKMGVLPKKKNSK